MTTENLFTPLVKLLNSNNQNLTLQTVTCLQNLINGMYMKYFVTPAIFYLTCFFFLETSISGIARAGAYEAIMKLCKASNAFLPKLSLIFAMILMDCMTCLLSFYLPLSLTPFAAEVQSRFVETGGAEFLLSFFNYNDAELQKNACRAVANVTDLYGMIIL
jgi:hypothetical protein